MLRSRAGCFGSLFVVAVVTGVARPFIGSILAGVLAGAVLLVLAILRGGRGEV